MKTLALTFTHEESTYLKHWKDYYSRNCTDTMVVDSEGGFRLDWMWQTPRINQLLPDLLRKYDVVVNVDVDEFVIPDPDKYKDLKEYLEQVTEPVVRCTGFNVMQMPDDDKLDFDKPLLAQREYYSHEWLYDKYVVLTEPQIYKNPHQIQKELEPDPELILFHMRDADLDSIGKRCKAVNREFDIKSFLERRETAIKIPEKYRGLL